MRFWFRELVGWCLLVLGLLGFAASYWGFLLHNHILEAGPMTFISFIVFRGGLQMLKIAVAARICLQAQEKMVEPKPRRAGYVASARPRTMTSTTAS